jgi:DNA-binding IclR family transcriptional regulator
LPGSRSSGNNCSNSLRETSVSSESFYRHGISSIVYPVFDRSGRVAAVVSILVPSESSACC